jgi:transposase
LATRKNYSVQFRTDAIELVRKNPNKPIVKVAEELGIPQTVLNNWIRRSGGRKEKAEAGPEMTESQRVKQLERELERTKEELAFAKKAAAFFARDLK